ncbi:hypothetical protein K2D_22330 [Planctomycetes bacterium K2D]|uniref:Uncharacterized protein n=1 Tax=Botrimarina mediterranea TaxID=2528022 RepID=A0A518K873_9BACT|nr:hypothetical protein Spa11_21950 [Botrimarina mediterranea]QDV78626.1 hypothetical protein K2D_22330 [Planctomycetes bacterium K2D]
MSRLFQAGRSHTDEANNREPASMIERVSRYADGIGR